MNNRPTGRDKKIGGTSRGVGRIGGGLGSGRVGRRDGYASRGQHLGKASGGSGEYLYRSPGQTASGAGRSGRGAGFIAVIIGIVILLIGGGGFGISSLFGDSGTQIYNSSTYHGVASAFSSGWSAEANDGKIDRTVADGAREKRTALVGSGKDTVTVMVYMCGTDLESKSGMASSDLSEMSKADISDKVNLIVYTGGASSWKNEMISSSRNQIYQVKSGGVKCLVKDDGNGPMTEPTTLSRFIKYSAENFPATRNILILWDHGGGSIAGFGYDEKNASAGSMTLSSIDMALSDAAVTFDLIGFDACLMATYENALMLEKYADYLIASEETEPGIGWYYTDWLTHLSNNSSYPTIDLGRQIADDFVKDCSERCPGQKATLSLVDLAELSSSRASFNAFATETASMCRGEEYAKVSSARGGARSFALSSKKDMVDLAHLCYRMGTDASDAMARAVVGAVKYNRVSANMANSYGLSVYFPYQKISGVEGAIREYEELGIDSDYTNAIRCFASIEAAGRSSYEDAAFPADIFSESYQAGGVMPLDGISDIIGSFLFGSGDPASGDYSFFSLDLDKDALSRYIADNLLDPSRLVWEKEKNQYVLSLTEDEWSIVNDLELNVFYDDGEGYIDLGLDNVFEFNENGDLIGEFDGTWLALDSYTVPYYHERSDRDNGETNITGYIPILLNGERAELLISFDKTAPDGYISGARRIYEKGETDTVAKSEAELLTGDSIEFICDYYSYGGDYIDSYVIASITYTGNHTLSNAYLPERENAHATYVFTDIYGAEHWTREIP
ncbi:MAG: peptidase C11 [Clostridia bacterium]|nr:peptidase C11 [Clostridia bacterium]